MVQTCLYNTFGVGVDGGGVLLKSSENSCLIFLIYRCSFNDLLFQLYLKEQPPALSSTIHPFNLDMPSDQQKL
jgi:hypothetical protein